MAVINRVSVEPWNAADDFSTKRYHLARAVGADLCAVASNPAEGLRGIIGVAMSNPRSGHNVLIAIGGMPKVVIGAAVEANRFLTTNGSGRAVMATSGQWSFGISLEAAANDGELIEMLLAIPARLIASDADL